MVLQLVAGGVSYEAYPSLAGTTPGVVTLPFVDWRPAPWDTANANRRITDADLRAVSQLNVYVNAVDGGASSGSIVIDDIAALPGVEPPPVFSDVPPGSANADSILWLHDQGLDTGYADGTFRPTKPETRQDAAALLYRYAKATFVPTAKKPTFLDVPKKHPAYTPVEWLASEKLVTNKAGAALLPGRAARQVVGRAAPVEPRGLARTGGRGDVHGRPLLVPVRARPSPGRPRPGVVTPVSATTYGVLRVVTAADMAGYLVPVRPPAHAAAAATAVRLPDGAQGWSSFAGTVAATDGALPSTAPRPTARGPASSPGRST